MKQDEQRNLELFADNVLTIKKEFVWQNTLIKRMAALLYAQQGKAVDCEAIRQCHTLIKKNTGVFSTFRGNLAICIATLLSLTPNPQEVLDESLKVYKLLKGAKFYASDFLVIAAFQIAVQAEPSRYEDVVARTRGFYEGMKAKHFFYTSQDDYIFAAMLGLSDVEVEAGSERIEQLYSRLKDEFWNQNSVQTLAQVLVLGNSDDSVASRVLALRDAFREQKIKLDKTYTLPILGVLALLPVEADTMIRDIGIAQDTLRTKKGFVSLSLTTQELLMFATSMVASRYAANVESDMLTATLSTSITSIIIAQQAAMLAAVAASAAASAAAASS